MTRTTFEQLNRLATANGFTLNVKALANGLTALHLVRECKRGTHAYFVPFANRTDGEEKFIEVTLSDMYKQAISVIDDLGGKYGHYDVEDEIKEMDDALTALRHAINAENGNC